MRKGVILLVLLVLLIPISFAKEVAIRDIFKVEEVDEIPSEEKSVSTGMTTYFYAGSKLLASKIGEELKYNYQDRLGSDVESKSLPFGQSIKVGSRFSFTGKEFDEELYYFGARYYNFDLGRFTSVDPVKDNNAYSYVENNPMNLIDPTGMDPIGKRSNARRAGYRVNRYMGQKKSILTSMAPYHSSVGDVLSLNVPLGERFIESGARYGVLPNGDYVDIEHITSAPQKIISEVLLAFGAGKESGQMSPFTVKMGSGDGPGYDLEVQLDNSLLNFNALSEDKLESISYGIFVELSKRFESHQGSFSNFLCFSSFAREDLPSNQISWVVGTSPEFGVTHGERVNRIFYALGVKPHFVGSKLWDNDITFQLEKYPWFSGDRDAMPSKGYFPGWFEEFVPESDKTSWGVVGGQGNN